MTTDIIEIDANKAVELLTWAVEQLGADNTYQSPKGAKGCVYVDKDTNSCSCIVAHALHHAGMTIDELAALDTQHPLHFASVAIGSVIFPDRVHITGIATKVLRTAQYNQDDGSTFGFALEQAIGERYILQYEQ